MHQKYNLLKEAHSNVSAKLPVFGMNTCTKCNTSGNKNQAVE